MERYDRQIRLQKIGQRGQAEIGGKTVLIVGCGALGTHASEQLVRAGIGKIKLIDMDRVSWSNLQRQALFDENDAARTVYKVEAAKKRLNKINSNVEVESYQEAFTLQSGMLLDDVDLVLDCTDNFTVRGAINQLAAEMGLPFIFASCASVAGSVMFVQPDKGPCLQCVFPDLGELTQTSCDQLGVFTPLVSFVASIQVSLALQYFVCPEEVPVDQLLSVDNWSMTINRFQVTKQANCMTCGDGDGSVKQSAQPLMVRLCGTSAYKVAVSDFSADQLEKILKAKRIEYRRTTKLMIFTIDTHDFTYFNSGQFYLYNFATLREATAYYEKLKALCEKEIIK